MTTATKKPANATMTPNARAAIKDLLLRLADDSLIVGHRNSEWTGQGPILEEDIAFSSMAQDKMGHALAFYTLVHELGEADPDRLAFGRSIDQYRCCSLAALPRGDWAMSLVRQFFFAEADAMRMAALSQSSYEPLAKLARKLSGEVKYHVMHGRMWVRKLGQAGEESCARLQAAVDALFGHALGMFEATKSDDALAADHIAPRELELSERWSEEVGSVFREAGLKAPKNAKPVYGGRAGKHVPELADLLEAMQRVFRLDPTAKW